MYEIEISFYNYCINYVPDTLVYDFDVLTLNYFVFYKNVL